jgi:hypothetical protein
MLAGHRPRLSLQKVDYMILMSLPGRCSSLTQEYIPTRTCRWYSSQGQSLISLSFSIFPNAENIIYLSPSQYRLHITHVLDNANMSNDWFYRYQTTILAVVLVFVPIIVICSIFMTALACSEYWSRRRGCSFSYFTCICGLRSRSQRQRDRSDIDDANSSERTESSRPSAEYKNPVSRTEQA